MNTNFTFSAPLLLKEIQTPANDQSASQSAARESFETKQTQQENKVVTKTADTDPSNVAEKKKAFSDYVRDAVTSQRSKDNLSADVRGDGGSQDIEDLRADISKLLEDIAAQVLDTASDTDKARDDAPLVLDGSESQDNDQTPLDTLLSLLSGIINTDGEEKGDELLMADEVEKLSETADLLSLLSDKLEALRALLSSDKFVLTSNLSADELQALKDQLAKALDEEENFNELALLNDILSKTAALVKPDPQVSARKQLISADKINQIGHQQSERYDYRYTLDGRAAAAGQDASGDRNSGQFRDALLAARTGSSGGESSSHSSSQSQTSLTAFLATDGALTFSQANGIFGFNGALPQQGAAHISTTTTVSSLVTQAQSATQPHPATQTVMASIQKYGTGKENTRIRIQLDPPELGRVEVKMSLNSDNSSKVVLTAEKPETFMMLQRDAHMLEKALNDAGLETDGGSLEFALADEGFDFNQDNKRGGGHDQGGTGSSSGESEDAQLVEATMDWQIDPRTGRMHYNVLV